MQANLENMSTIQKIPLAIKYKKQNGILVFDLDNLTLPTDFKKQEKSLVIIPPQQIGGNHKHPRTEILIALTDTLEIHWIDGEQHKHHEIMSQANQFSLFLVPPYLPHAVINLSNEHNAALYELANAPQHDVETVSVI